MEIFCENTFKTDKIPFKNEGEILPFKGCAKCPFNTGKCSNIEKRRISQGSDTRIVFTCAIKWCQVS